jgi:hypothetical protein
MEWTHTSLRGGWWAMGRDPIGILAPAAGVLLVQAMVMGVIRGVVFSGTPAFVLGIAVAFAVVVQAPLRLRMLRAGGRVLGSDKARFGATLSLLVVDGVTLLVQALLAAIILVPALFLATVALSREIPVVAAIVGGGGVVISSLLWVLGRSLFAYSPARVVAGSGPFTALRQGFHDASGDRLQILLIAAAGDALFALGGLLCGAGALPGYPFADMAFLHRWRSRDVPEAGAAG